MSEVNLMPGQTFQLQFTVEGAASAPQINIPVLQGLVIHDTFENKTTTISTSGTRSMDVYSKVLVLSASKAGKYKVPAATAVVDGKSMRSQPITITIHNRSINALNRVEPALEPIPISQLSQLTASENADERIKKNLFIRAFANKTSCFAGEGLMVTYKMYSRLNTSSQILKRPSLAGLSIVDMIDNYEKDAEMEEVNGVPYYVSMIRKVQGFPLQPGALKMDIAQIASTVHFVRIDDAGKVNAFDYPVTLSSNEIAVNVKPLPTANQPENFLGAVGKFKLIIEALAKEIHPGDLVKIRVLIKGQGNIPLLVAPNIKWPKGVDTTEPAVREEFNKTEFPLEGFKSFEYSFTAPDTGNYIIPATELVYFNPSTQTYERSISDSVTLNVTPGKAEDRSVVENALAESNRKKAPSQFLWFGVVVAAILFGIGYNIWAAKKKKPAEVQIQKTTAEQQSAIKVNRLEKATAALQEQQMILFYRELEYALWTAAADSFNVLPSELNKRTIRTVFESKGVDAGTTALFEEVMNECEWALYVPQHEMENAEAALQKARAIVDKLA